MYIMGPGKKLSEVGKNPGNLLPKQGTNPVNTISLAA